MASIDVTSKPLAFGVVCSAVEAIPPQRGRPAIKVEPAAAGPDKVCIALVWPNPP
ncbi:MAG: hypothetical protein L0Z62_26735 [Gemmataceae bacterium]|nr:hypothetical protein [Gemmataceae bacterium]